MLTELLVIGAGGHAKVVIEAIQAAIPACRIILADQDETKAGTILLGSIPIQLMSDWDDLPHQYHIAIGNNLIRQKFSKDAQQYGNKLYTVIHPAASVSPSSVIGVGTFIAAKTVIGAESHIGENCIVNHGAIVDHDCRIDSFSHIAPNATLGGGVTIGRGCLIGAGAIVLASVKVGNNSVVGAGAVVTCDIPDDQTVIGIPAKCI